MDVLGFLIGRRLANREGEGRKITAIEGVPAMGLDGLASSAYGPEAALTILMPAGALGLHVVTPIMAAILALLALLCFSYWQTIEAYPSNGGSYTVAKENLGANAGLLAASPGPVTSANTCLPSIVTMNVLSEPMPRMLPSFVRQIVARMS